MKHLRHSLLGLFLLTGACGGPIEDGSTETSVPGTETGQEESTENGGPSAQAMCDYEYSYGSCGSCLIPASTPGQVSAMAYPGQTVRKRYCCLYSSGSYSCGSWSSAGCSAC